MEDQVSWTLVLVAVPLGLLAISALITLPPRVTLVGLVLARALTDIGASSGGSLLPSSTLSGAISVALIAMAGIVMLKHRRWLTPRLVGFASACSFAILMWTLVGVMNFGVDSGLILDSVRLLSYVGTFVAAYLAFSRDARSIVPSVAVLTIVPAVILVGSFLVGWAPTINGSGRAVGTFSHANSAAAYMAIAAVSCFGLYFYARRKLLLWSAGIAVAALGVTQSLGGVLGFALAALVVILANSSLSMIRRFSILLLAGVAAVVAFLASPASARLSELDGIDPGRALATGVSANSLEWRFINWQLLGERWWSESPWTGFGLGASSSYVMPLGAPPHSMIVEIAVETGVLGIFSAIILLAILSRGIRRIDNVALRAVALAIVVFVVVNGSESNLLGYTASGFLALLVLGALLSQRAGRKSDARRPSESQRVPDRRLVRYVGVE